MTRSVRGAFAIAMIAAATSAGAADLQRGRAGGYTVNTPLAMSWMGPYLGVNAGYQWGQISNDPTRPSGILGGIQAGFNWRTGDLVYGSEIDAQITGADAVFAPWKFANPWFGTARGRVGYAFQNVLLYGTGGVAIGGVRAESMLLTELHTAFGWTAGLGAEFKFAQNWSAKAEYLYINLANRPFSITGVTNGYKFNVLRVGVNYHF